MGARERRDGSYTRLRRGQQQNRKNVDKRREGTRERREDAMRKETMREKRECENEE